MNLVRSLAGFAAASFVVHAAFTPFYEVGMTRFFSPLFFLQYALLFFAFALQKTWARKWVVYITLALPVMSVIFPPTPEFFGSNTRFARGLVSVESALCVAIFVLIQYPRVKEWLTFR
jgi:hypothetical protein